MDEKKKIIGKASQCHQSLGRKDKLSMLSMILTINIYDFWSAKS